MRPRKPLFRVAMPRNPPLSLFYRNLPELTPACYGVGSCNKFLSQLFNLKRLIDPLCHYFNYIGLTL